jgi:hypothetical protein
MSVLPAKAFVVLLLGGVVIAAGAQEAAVMSRTLAGARVRDRLVEDCRGAAFSLHLSAKSQN